MKLEQITENLNFPRKSFVATIGFFDGVHVGHRFLLRQLTETARACGKWSLVISFDAHPKTVLRNDNPPPLLTTNDEKIAILEELGIDACAILHFNRQMADLSAREFLEQMIVNRLGVHTLLIGYDHRFGRNREEGFEQYQQYGKELGLNIVQIDPYEQGEKHVSSSVIRRLLSVGDVAEGNRLLTYPYSLTGTVVHGAKIGRTLGFPTANIVVSDARKLIPANGVYAVKVLAEGKSCAGMLNIGVRPTVDNSGEKTIEVHILNFDGDLYGKEIRVSFLQKIRDERKFQSKDELVAQLRADREEVLRFYSRTQY